MDGHTLKQIRDVLLDRRKRLDVSDHNREFQNEDLSNQAEIIDMAQALEAMERAKSLQEQERRELEQIELAIGRLATGGYGVCEDCSEEIPAKRLMIVPEARLCARCQAIEEREQSRRMVRIFPKGVSYG